jgi:hypothetical protein
MRKLFRAYRLLNILSLDIVLGSVVCALFFGDLLEVKILPYGLLGLALTVWIIYTTDHLLDAKSIAGVASSERHRFHQQHFRKLRNIVIVVLLIDFIIILFTRRPVMQWGFCLALLVLAYLLVQRYLKVMKEFFVALFYTCGILLPALSVTTVELTSGHFSIFIQFFFVAFTNLMLFSWFDRDEDRADKQHSLVTTSGKVPAVVLVWSVAVLSLGLTLYLLIVGFDIITIATTAGMHMLLLFVFVFNRQMRNRGYYRLIGDSVFLIPVFSLLWVR